MKKIVIGVAVILFSMGAFGVAFAQTDGAVLVTNDAQARELRTPRVKIQDGIPSAGTTTTNFGAIEGLGAWAHGELIPLSQTAEPDLIQGA